MLTSRGWWFLITASGLAVGGTVLLGGVDPFVPLLGLTTLGWFLGSWFQFVRRVRTTAGRIGVRREVQISGRTVSVVWAGSRP